MGGSAFARASAEGQPTLSTPRLSPAEYEGLKTRYTRALRAALPDSVIAVLKEAPEKESYGDIDFIVSRERPVDFERLASEVGAAGIIHAGSICSLAVPKDGSALSAKPIRYQNARDGRPEPSLEVTEQEFAQIDVALIPPRLFSWHAFYASYGDMSGLLGAIMHNLGFTISDKGLHLRLMELDEAKLTSWLRVADRDGILFLSSDPQQVVGFFGLSWDRYERGFDTMDAFYSWLAGCKFVSCSMEQYKRKNKSNQRQKEMKRSIINNFLREFLPRHFCNEDLSDSSKNTTTEGDVQPTRPDLSQRRALCHEQAIAFFGKHAEHSTLREALIKSIHNQTAERLLKPMVAEHSGRQDRRLAESMRAFRRWVDFFEGQAYISVVPHSDQESELRRFLADDKASLREPGAVDAFIKEHWKELQDLERHGRQLSNGDE